MAAAQLTRRLAVEGVLLAATSAPLCLDPSPAVAAYRRAARATATAVPLPAASHLTWSCRTQPPPPIPPGQEVPEPRAAWAARRVARWLAAAGDLQPPLHSSSGFEWATGLSSAGGAGGQEHGPGGAEWSVAGGARWGCYGDVEVGLSILSKFLLSRHPTRFRPSSLEFNAII